MVKKRINKILSSVAGVKVVRATPKANNIPFLDVEHPLEAYYRVKKFPFVMNLPLARGRVMRWYPTTADSLCPFIVGAKVYLDEGLGYEGVKNVLTTYAKSISKHDGNDAYGLSGKNKTFPQGDHCRKISEPWWNIEPSKYFDIFKKQIIKENKLYGYNEFDFLYSGNPSLRKIYIEATRTLELIQSIKNDGYVCSSNNCISGIILSQGKDYRWCVIDGAHRISILAALKKPALPIRIHQIVRKTDVAYWPNVKSGLFSEEAALQVFDRIFEATPPPVYDKWVMQFKSKELDQDRR